MLKKSHYSCDIFSKRYIEAMLPQEHILLDIKRLVKFSFVTEEVKDLYSDTGRGSIDPEKMFKMLFLMYFCNIPSERDLVEQVQVNVLYRYFCDINLDEKMPEHSSFTVFRQRLGKERFKRFFNRILEECIRYDLIEGRHISFDATVVSANVRYPNKRKKEEVIKEAERLIDRTYEEKFIQKTVRGNKEIPLSKTDPDARWTRRGKKGSTLGYNAHISTDSKEKIITNIDTTPANIAGHDKMIELLAEQIKEHKLEVKEVSADSEYSAGEVRKELEKREIDAYIPIYDRGGKHREGMFGYEEFAYDKERDCVICPEGQIMRYMKDKTDARVYRSYQKVCKRCKAINKCTRSGRGYRTVEISHYYETIKRAEIRNKTERYKEAKKIRLVNTEPKFAEAKRYHGLNRCRYRGLEQVSIQVILTAICLNIKRLARVVTERLTVPAFQEALAYR